MSDFCDCVNCPHHCEAEDMENKLEPKSVEDKIKNLEADISALGFRVEETKEGIRVS
jgi:hypothetical protein